MNFELNLSAALAHTLVFERRQAQVAVVGPHVEYYNGGDPPAPTAQESTAEMLKAYTEYLPSLMSATSQQVLPTERTLLAAQQEIAPGQMALDRDLLQQFGPEFARIMADIDRSNRMKQSQADADILAGPGRDVMRNALAAQREADPEFFKAREQMGAQYDRLLGSLDDPNAGLSGSERTEIDRSLARANLGRGIATPTAQSTVANAMAFGQAGAQRQQQRQAAIGQALGVGTQMAPAMRSGIDTFQMVTGRPSVNTGAERVGGAQQVGQQTFGMGQNFLGNIQQNQASSLNYQANRRSGMDRATALIGSLPSVDCCFIFAEAYGGFGNIPWFVRASRDWHMTPEKREGYIWMSKWLVPLMARYDFVFRLVYETMIVPLTEHAGWLYGIKGYEHGAARGPWHKFWQTTWAVLGWLRGVPQKYDQCEGRSWRLGRRWLLERWKCPPRATVPEHHHAEFDSYLIPVRGSGRFMRGDRWVMSTRFKRYRIPRGVTHTFVAGPRGLTFFNFERWYSEPTSASVDFNND